MNEKTHETSTVASRSGIKEEWLALHKEDGLEPAPEIVDPHHHLWDFARHRYLLHDLLADAGSGHNVTQTVFIECTACYRADGAAAMRPVGETEFVNGIAAMSARGGYGPIRVAAGIGGCADLTLGAAVEEVLAAHLMAGGGRFRGIRHAAGWKDQTPDRETTRPHSSHIPFT